MIPHCSLYLLRHVVNHLPLLCCMQKGGPHDEIHEATAEGIGGCCNVLRGVQEHFVQLILVDLCGFLYCVGFPVHRQNRNFCQQRPPHLAIGKVLASLYVDGHRLITSASHDGQIGVDVVERDVGLFSLAVGDKSQEKLIKHGGASPFSRILGVVSQSVNSTHHCTFEDESNYRRRVEHGENGRGDNHKWRHGKDFSKRAFCNLDAHCTGKADRDISEDHQLLPLHDVENPSAALVVGLILLLQAKGNESGAEVQEHSNPGTQR
mmetsp:Transcript_106576/g.189498  ORF Transcript_106576/g.189498 Transcript_106576/m.189498 type:complete len:264 (-) Transcript_106576:1283-2074(-)